MPQGSRIPPRDQHFVRPEPLCARRLAQRRGLAAAERQQPRPRDHGPVVDAVAVIRRVPRAVALLCACVCVRA